jgi:hypothetical protein
MHNPMSGDVSVNEGVASWRSLGAVRIAVLQFFSSSEV